MLDKGDQTGSHESAGADGRTRSGHLGHLDDAACSGDLDPSPGPARDDLERLSALSSIDNGLDAITLHGRSIRARKKGARTVTGEPSLAPED
jgi:hypothetical protein